MRIARWPASRLPIGRAQTAAFRGGARPAEFIGGTPMKATETVAVPIYQLHDYGYAVLAWLAGMAVDDSAWGRRPACRFSGHPARY